MKITINFFGKISDDYNNMIFDNTSDTRSYEISREELRKNPDINWFLWRLNAQNDNDVRDLTQFLTLVRKSTSGSVPLTSLNEWGSGLNQSRILRSMIRENLAETNDKEITLLFPVIDRKNIGDYLTKITDYYHKIIHSDHPEFYPYPSSYFYLIESEVCKTIPIHDLGWQTFDSESFSGKLIEIVFPRFHIPPVLATPESVSELIQAAKEKIIRKLAQTASENGDFFSRYIKFDGFSIKKRFPVLTENDLLPIKSKKGQDYQYGYTLIFLDKVFAKPESATEYINAVNFEQYSELGVLFSPSKKENYDFIQSYLLYRELTLPQTENKRKNIKKLEEKLLACLRLYMTESELKEQILLSMPDVSMEYREKVFADFHDLAVSQEKTQDQFTILFFSVDFFGNRETIYIHASNFNRYLNKTLGEVSEPMEKQIRVDWKQKLKKYKFVSEMFSVYDFNGLIYGMIKRKDSILYQILRQNKCLFYLTKLKTVNQYASKLILNGTDNIAETLKLYPDKIYTQLVAEIKKEKSFLGRLIFGFLSWYYLRAYKNSIESREKKRGGETLKDAEDTGIIFSAIGVKSANEIDEKCNALWSELGADQVPRKALENNIKTDLLEYFKNRDRVLPPGLQVIVERNSNRIVRQAPHLAVYQEKLNEFIRLYAYKVIASNPSLRGKYQNA